MPLVRFPSAICGPALPDLAAEAGARSLEFEEHRQLGCGLCGQVEARRVVQDPGSSRCGRARRLSAAVARNHHGAGLRPTPRPGWVTRTWQPLRGTDLCVYRTPLRRRFFPRPRRLRGVEQSPARESHGAGRRDTNYRAMGFPVGVHGGHFRRRNGAPVLRSPMAGHPAWWRHWRQKARRESNSHGILSASPGREVTMCTSTMCL